MRGRTLLAAAALIAIVAGLAVPEAALAQNRAKSYEWSLFVGRTTLSNELDLKDSFYYGTRIGWNFTKRYQLEFTGAIAPTAKENDPLAGGNTRVFNLTTAVNFNFPIQTENKWKWRWVPYATLGVGYTNIDYQQRANQDDYHFAWGGGVRWFGTEKVGARLEVRGLTETGGDYTNFEYTLGLTFVSGGTLRDTDGDTVPDSKDQCPGTPLGCLVNQWGCELDDDGDGVCDGLDKCPNTRVGCIVDSTGCDVDDDGDGVCNGIDECPATPPGCRVDEVGCETDADGDGVCDGVDKCPGTPKGCQVKPDGCEKDGDRDGVCDGIDQCPNTPRGCLVDARGCERDTDGDGVCDGVDQCPNTPKGMEVDERGCETELNFPAIQFDFNRAKVKQEYVSILEKAIKAMRDNPRLRVLIIGHTDNIGGVEYNIRLSQRRAEAVKNWLVSNGGIDPARFETEGQGKCCPIAPNDTEEGRYKNRRVVFRRIR